MRRCTISAAAPQNKQSYSSAVCIMMLSQLGGVVVVGPHLLPGNFKDYCRKRICMKIHVHHEKLYHSYKHTFLSKGPCKQRRLGGRVVCKKDSPAEGAGKGGVCALFWDNPLLGSTYSPVQMELLST